MPTRPNQAWAGDITFIPTTSCWLYLAVVLDLGSRRVIGWSLDTHMRSELVVRALQQALQARRQKYDNQEREHSAAIGYLTPNQFKAQYINPTDEATRVE